MMTLKRDGKRLIFDNGYWQVTHDLKQGGAICEVRFPLDDGENFLARPLEVRNGAFSSLCLLEQRDFLRRTRDGYHLRVEGRLGDAAGQPGPAYQVEYRYTDACARVTHTLRGATGEVNCWSAAFTSRCVWVNAEHPMFGTHPKDRWYQVRGEGVMVDMADAPFAWGGFADCGAGLQFIMSQVPESWRGASRFMTEIASGTVTQSSLHAATDEMTWGFQLAPTSYGRGEACKYREAVICSQPFPSDEELVQMKDLGVNLVRIHEGANWKNDSDDFWMHGVYPPYPGKNLQEMKRVIATCHRLGIPIYGYSCLTEVHPFSEAFLKHPTEWIMKMEGKYARWSGPLTDQLWGAPMCSASGFGDWLVRHNQRIVTEYGFDGVYFDGGCCGYGVHDHGKDGIIAHATTDSHLRVLEQVRRKLPGKFIVLHQGCSGNLNVALLNACDHLVTFEEMGADPVPSKAADLPFTMRVAQGCISSAIVPGIFVPDGGVALTRCLYGFSYEEGHYPVPSRAKLQRGIPAFLLNGNLPYSYYFNEDFLWAYRTYQDRKSDTEGLYALFQALKAVDDTSGRFFPWFRCPYHADVASVGVASIEQAGQTILIIANQSPTPADTRITGPGLVTEMAMHLDGYGYRFVKVKAGVPV